MLFRSKKQGVTKSGDNSTAMAEIAAFTTALAAASTAPQQQAIIQTEAKVMAEPKVKTVAQPAGKSAEQLAFEAQMDALNAEMLAAKTPAQQQVVAEKQKQTIVFGGFYEYYHRR